MEDKRELLRKFPSMEIILSSKKFKELEKTYARNLILKYARKEVECLKNQILKEKPDKEFEDGISIEKIYFPVKESLEKWAGRGVKRIINATGIILHTNLGRSPLSLKARERASEVLKGYSSLEIDIETGRRGKRHERVEELLRELSGAESAMVVNNDSAAVLLVLMVLAREKEVIISRGELVEIGGGFRVPDVIKRSGCHLVEIGTTNKTRISDYRGAVTEETALLLKVHTSNFKIIGFTASASIEELKELSVEKDIPVFYDQGNGLMVNLSEFGIEGESTVIDIINKGVDIVAFSGDKLFGGPQAGIILGKKKYMDRIKKDPLVRALRTGKETLALLEATIEEYLSGNHLKNIPVLKMLGLTQEELKEKAIYVSEHLKPGSEITVDIIEGLSEMGGGTLPGVTIPTFLISVKPSVGVKRLQEKLRMQKPPIYCRLWKDQLLMDMRTIQEEDMAEFLSGIQKALATMKEKK